MTEERKKDHLALTSQSRPASKMDLGPCHYEPLLAAHPQKEDELSIHFLDHEFKLPLWVSSMTGGTEKAKNINRNLARACNDFGMGMGLGSCRALLDSDSRFADFDVKELMGDAPLFTNFGIAQLEQLVEVDKLSKIVDVTNRLQAQGIIIHVNPLQEYAQPEGDRFKYPPIDTIKRVLDIVQLPVIVKEVGQGMGPRSLQALCALPLSAIELAAFGGTNFTLLEQTRLNGGNFSKYNAQNSFGLVGHSNQEMIGWLNELSAQDMQCQQFIISGGINDALAGHILMQSLKYPSVMGMASALLEHAQGEYENLYDYLLDIKQQLLMARAYIRRG